MDKISLDVAHRADFAAMSRLMADAWIRSLARGG